MADKKISELTELTAPAATDMIPIMDASAGDTKKIAFSTVTPTWINSALTLYVDPAGNDTTGDGSVGTPWATVGKAISYLADFRMDAIVTISLGKGVYTESNIVINHPDSRHIEIVGPDVVTKTMSSVQSSSGSSGAWSIVVNLNSVADIDDGDFAIFTNCTGGTRPRVMIGLAEVTNVDSGNTRITVASPNIFASAPSGNVTGDVTIIKAVLDFDATDGITVKSALSNGVDNYLLNNLVLDQVGAAGTTTGCDMLAYGNGSGALANVVGVNGFQTCVKVSYGLHTFNTTLWVAGGTYGAWVMHGGGCHLTGGANGCTTGFHAKWNAFIKIASQTVVCCTTGIKSEMGSVIDATSGVICNCVTGVYVQKYGYIYAASATVADSSTDDYDPNVNTQGNEYGYIDT